MAVHQSHSLFKFLAHNYQRIIDRAVAVGMVFTHGIAYDTGGFPVWLVIIQAQLAHIIEHPALNGL